MNSKEGNSSLLEVGFTPRQVERLSEFRKDYVEKQERQTLTVQRRLEFIRWLVTTGRLR